MRWNSWGIGESFKAEDGSTSCMAFSSGQAFCIWPLSKGLINPSACRQALDPSAITTRLLFEQILPGVTLSALHHLKGQTQQMAWKTVLSLAVNPQLTNKSVCSSDGAWTGLPPSDPDRTPDRFNPKVSQIFRWVNTSWWTKNANQRVLPSTSVMQIYSRGRKNITIILK